MEKFVPIFYFSGTGNTWWVGNRIAEALNTLGYQAKAHSIEQLTPIQIIDMVDSAEIVSLGYPIYGSDAPEIMKSFIENLPVVNTPKKMMIYITELEWSGNGAYFMRRKIEAKGYTVKWAIHFKMPNNIALDVFPFKGTAEYAEFANKLVDATNKAHDLAQRIHADRKWIHNNNPFSWAAAWIQRGPFRWSMKWIQGRTFSVGKENCTHCGRCERLCPVDNIHLTLLGEPEWSDKCILCMRCFNYCPEQTVLVYNRPFNPKRFGKKPFQGPVPEFRPEMIARKKEKKTLLERSTPQ